MSDMNKDAFQWKEIKKEYTSVYRLKVGNVTVGVVYRSGTHWSGTCELPNLKKPTLSKATLDMAKNYVESQAIGWFRYTSNILKGE